jgi:hypothetical protein
LNYVPAYIDAHHNYVANVALIALSVAEQRNNTRRFLSQVGLPDGIFSDQKSQFG